MDFFGIGRSGKGRRPPSREGSEESLQALSFLIPLKITRMPLEEIHTSEERVVTASAPTPTRAVERARTGRIVYYILGIIEVLLAFRLVFKLLGANPMSPFIQFIYFVSGIFHAPFSGIFSQGTARGAETTAVFEPSTVIAMIVYAIIAWGIVKLIVVSATRPDQVEKGL